MTSNELNYKSVKINEGIFRMSDVSNGILLDRAKTLAINLLLIMQEYIDRAYENETKRTTMTLATLRNINNGIALINPVLDEIKL